MQNRKSRRFFAVLFMCILTFTLGTICSAIGEAPETPAVETADTNLQFAVDYEDGEDPVEYDLTDGDSALAYAESYADNLQKDPDFKSHIGPSIDKVRESICNISFRYKISWIISSPNFILKMNLC